MADKETGQTKELADIIVEKFRILVDLESRVLDAREEISRISVAHDDVEGFDRKKNPIVEHEKMLTQLELQLKGALRRWRRLWTNSNWRPLLSGLIFYRR